MQKAATARPWESISGAFSAEFSAPIVENCAPRAGRSLSLAIVPRARILVVEDEADIAEILSYSMERERVTVEAVGSADVAFESIRHHDPGRARSEGGMGLGLAIVKHAAQLHGGRVEAESRVGEGSVFRVLLPLALAEI